MHKPSNPVSLDNWTTFHHRHWCFKDFRLVQRILKVLDLASETRMDARQWSYLSSSSFGVWLQFLLEIFISKAHAWGLFHCIVNSRSAIEVERKLAILRQTNENLFSWIQWLNSPIKQAFAWWWNCKHEWMIGDKLILGCGRGWQASTVNVVI